MLKLRFKDNNQNEFWVTEKRYSIGSGRENHLIIHNDPTVDKLHAKLIHEENKFLLKDNNSSSGSFINGQRITQKEILPGDIIKLGNTELIVLDPRRQRKGEDNANTKPWQLVSDSSWLPGKTFIVPAERPVIIGRADQCDICIPGTHLSRKHTELRVEGAVLRIKDLGSSNGTYLNEKLITEGAGHDDDRLRLDVYTFRLVAPTLDSDTAPTRASIESLSKLVERKQASSEPKKWKTRPTSPGNRIEPILNKSYVFSAKWVVTLIVVIIVSITATLLW